jgi:BirA family biotin operon repressor/biotin-[acetyl-CoA-carboxylase] ligase
LTGWPPGVGLLRLDEVDSTNDEARRRAAEGETGPLWIMAARQSAGRGRRGRHWESGEGNLAATLLLRFAAPPVAGQLGFAAALAVADMAAHFAPKTAITVKWPNDVLAGARPAEVDTGSASGRATKNDMRKLAGILLESGSDSKAGGWLAVGIGVNLAWHPAGTEFPATSLAALGAVPPAPEVALGVLAIRFCHWHALWQDEGFAPLRAAWLARAGGLGRPIRARLPHEERHGAFEGIDMNGALLLREGMGVRAIAAGEVFF